MASTMSVKAPEIINNILNKVRKHSRYFKKGCFLGGGVRTFRQLSFNKLLTLIVSNPHDSAGL